MGGSMEQAKFGKVEGYKTLTVYQKAYELAIMTYQLTRKFPKEEVYGLTAQIRRAAISIPSNICEGYRRFSRNDYIRFLRMAYGSCAELQTQISICHDLEFMESTAHEKISLQIEEVSKLLWRLLASLKVDAGDITASNLENGETILS
jgi:four helix bundle protein